MEKSKKIQPIEEIASARTLIKWAPFKLVVAERSATIDESDGQRAKLIRRTSITKEIKDPSSTKLRMKTNWWKENAMKISFIAERKWLRSTQSRFAEMAEYE